ncbi:hypothetical protein Val02_69190 [Virgisporangium aliadipatigenens]|uniref:Uncharacterized protein n=1 Tax=Virgisporangium aliadipatigenens TaxID=741659 RepID=A0A8J3YUL0_9ACTN|nr:hypothetical protein [Virgisporangium aliadipatigenens]GIJ50033.1 hypothetical protein Val02_69190 [Virgisporangium aliadipatigenens]
MSALDAVAAEATRDRAAPLLERRMHGRTWRFGTIDVRPARLRRYAVLAESVEGRPAEEISGAQAVELAGMAEEMLRSALPAVDRDAFDDAPFTGTEIGELISSYFAAVGVGPGESAASPVSSPRGRRRSRRTSRR